MNEHVKLSGLDWTKIKQSLGGEWNDDIDNSVEYEEKMDCCENLQREVIIQVSDWLEEILKHKINTN